MYSNVVVERKLSKFLTAKYVFTLIDVEVFLDKFTLLNYVNKPRKGEVVKYYSRLDKRDRNLEQVDIPEDVIEEALAKLRELIVFKE